MTKGPENRTFKNKGLSVRPLEATEEVVAEDIHNFSEDIIRLYFENVGGDVENVVLNEAEQSAIITFKHRKGTVNLYKYYSKTIQHQLRSPRFSLMLDDVIFVL